MSQGEINLGYTTIPAPQVPAGTPDYVWELATIEPAQGEWTRDSYLELTDGANRLIELVEGRLEFLAMPTELHQELLLYVMDLLRAFAATHGGKVMFSGIRVETTSDNFRQPDVAYLREENFDKRSNRFWRGSDLAVEIVSPDDKSRKRDLSEKRVEYAAAGIPEYWIVDPQEEKIIVLTLPESASEYVEHGLFEPGDTATSKLLAGFSVDVQAAFDAAKPPTKGDD